MDLLYEGDLDGLKFVPGTNSAFEFWTVTDGPPIFTELGKLEESDIENWILQRKERFKQPEGTVSGLRIISSGSPNDRFNRTIPFSKEVFQRLLEALMIPRSFVWICYSSLLYSEAFSNFGQSANELAFGIVCSIKSFARSNEWTFPVIAISFIPEMQMTNVLLYGFEGAQEMTILLTKLQDFATFAVNPSLAGVVFADIMIHLLSRDLQIYFNDLYHTEIQMGHIKYIDTQLANAEDINHSAFTIILNTLQSKLQIVLLSLRHLHEFLGEMDSITNNIDIITKDRTELSSDWRRQYENSSNRMERHAKHLRSRIICLIENAKTLSETCSNAVTVIYTLMNVRENRNSQKLAAESTRIADESKKLASATQRDSSAMLGIAILTIFFLPATFVASLLALPMLDWGADITQGESVVSGRFYVYWAITIPLTVLVLGIYGFWMLKPFGSLLKKEKVKKDL